MEHKPQIRSVGSIYALLSEASRRPRYAFLVLQLVAEIADQRGHAGPFVCTDCGKILLREWLCHQLLPLSEQSQRRAALRARVSASLVDSLTGDELSDTLLIEQSVEEQVHAVGRANISRAISDLVRAGLLSRHYAGYATNHRNPGGGRNAVYVVPDFVMQVLPKARGPQMVEAAPSQVLVRQPRATRAGQGDLFAA
ncbi:MAG: hypothetical protein B7X96_02880 [Novosphingobium sp. 17-62-8]|nr:MAG: hypothetical protein B7X96_02880 [Novosphingobium sp. 17-62-8]